MDVKENVSERIEFIDGLRGICAIIVVMNHFIVGFFPVAYFGVGTYHLKYNIEQVLAQSPLSFWYAGNFVVCIFCTISAYIIATKFFENEQSVVRTATNRYFRLVLPTFCISLIAFLFMKIHFFKNIETAVLTGSPWLSDFYNFKPDIKDLLRGSFYDIVFDGYDRYNTVFWMIPILFNVTFLTIFTLKIWGRIRKRYLVYGVLILLLFKQGHIYELTFIAGIICADLKVNFKEQLNKYVKERYSLILIIIGVYLGAYPTGMVPTNAWYSWMNPGQKCSVIWHILGSFLFMFGILNLKIAMKLLSNKILLWLGKISFPIFLIHIIVICSFSCSFFNILYQYSNNYLMSFIVMWSSSMGLIILVSYLFNISIDKYTNHLVKKITRFILKD